MDGQSARRAVGLGGKAIAKNWLKYGLLKPGTKLGSNGSKFSWGIGDVVGGDIADRDPYEYFGKVVIPALKKHGVDLTNKSAVLAAAVGLYGRATGQRMASTFLDPQQRARIDADKKLTTGAMGVDELRWLRPVRPGDTLRGRNEVIDKKASKSRPEMGIVRNKVTLFNQQDEPVLTMIPIAMWRTRPA